MKRQTERTTPFRILHNLLASAAPIFLCGFAGHTEVQYQGSSPKGTYDAKVTIQAGPNEKYSWWSMDITRNGQAFISDYYFSPFYSWTCVDRGKAKWTSESVLHFRNFSAQGRSVEVSFQNDTNESIEYAELCVRSVDSKGYPHSPSIIFLFDVDRETALLARPEIFPGAEYFTIKCECRGKTATGRFKVPSKRGAPHDVNLDPKSHRIRITLSPTGLAVDDGSFEEVPPQTAKEMVPGGVRLHLVEEKRDHRKKNKLDAGNGK